MHVISASRRTDIPAFYTEWLLSRLQAGFCEWINPFGGEVRRVSLRAEDVLALVFWTRDPRPLLPHLPALRSQGYYSYAAMTLNAYPRALEPHNPPFAEALAAIRRLSEALSPRFTLWRYDPILLGNVTTPAFHLERFAALCGLLQGYTQRCTISFAEYYGKTARHLAQVARETGLVCRPPETEERQQLAGQLREIAAAHGITLFACCNADLVASGIRKARCINPDLLRLLRPDVNVQLASAPSRRGCGCVRAVDIGAYDTCLHGCAYCYATQSPAAAAARHRAHVPSDTLLWRPLRTPPE